MLNEERGNQEGKKKRKQTFSLALISCWEISFRLFYEESRFVKVPYLSKMYSQYYFIWLKVVTYITRSKRFNRKMSVYLFIQIYLQYAGFCSSYPHLHRPCHPVIFQVWSVFFSHALRAFVSCNFNTEENSRPFPQQFTSAFSMSISQASLQRPVPTAASSVCSVFPDVDENAIFIKFTCSIYGN